MVGTRRAAKVERRSVYDETPADRVTLRRACVRRSSVLHDRDDSQELLLAHREGRPERQRPSGLQSRVECCGRSRLNHDIERPTVDRRNRGPALRCRVLQHASARLLSDNVASAPNECPGFIAYRVNNIMAASPSIRRRADGATDAHQ